MIANARGTVATGRDRRGITHGLGTYEFKTTPMARRIAGSTGPTQMMGTKGIGVERYSNGITRAAKTNVLGYSSHVRAPHLNGPNGLSTLHTTGRAWSSFHPNGSSR